VSQVDRTVTTVRGFAAFATEAVTKLISPMVQLGTMPASVAHDVLLAAERLAKCADAAHGARVGCIAQDLCDMHPALSAHRHGTIH
jgi:hypothetical protein